VNNQLIKKEQWKEFFEFTSKMMRGQQFELEVAGMDIGDQIGEEWSNLEGLSYDPRNNILFIHTEKDDHPISDPVEVVASGEGTTTQSIAIKEANGNVQIVRFREPIKIDA